LCLKVEGDIKEDGTFNDRGELCGLHDDVKVKFDVTLLPKVEKDKAPLADEEAEEKVARNNAKVDVSYSNKDVDANLSVFKKQLNDVVVAADFAAKVHENVALGLSVSGKPLKAKPEDNKYRQVLNTDFTLKLFTEDSTIVGSLQKAGSVSKLGVTHKVCDKLTVGAQWTKKLNLSLPWCFKGEKEVEEKVEEKEGEEKKEEVKPKDWKFVAGFSLKSDHNTTVSGKFNDEGDVSGAYEFDLKQNLRASLALETNVRELGKNAKVGVSFTYSE